MLKILKRSLSTKCSVGASKARIKPPKIIKIVGGLSVIAASLVIKDKISLFSNLAYA